MDPRYQEMKRKWDEFVAAETAVWPSDKPTIVIEYSVFGMGWEENGISGVRGKASVWSLQQIEIQLKVDLEIGEEHLLKQGDGDYLLAVTYDDGEADEYGRVIHAPFWDMSVIGFRTFEQCMAASVAEQEKSQ